MSVGHLLKYEQKSPDELRKVLDTGDTRKLAYTAFALDHRHTIPYGGGISVDGKTVYIDAQLYREVISGKMPVPGMTPLQVIEHWCKHERTERAVSFGDNLVDLYEPSHEFAETAEHEDVDNPRQYENAQRVALMRTLHRPASNPPKDLWCGPYLDHPDKRDKQILRSFRAHGVEDAFKFSKFDYHYGVGPAECRDCAMFSQSVKGPLRPCDDICGLVRDTRYCDRWVARKIGAPDG